jgi:hypothetical protein
VVINGRRRDDAEGRPGEEDDFVPWVNLGSQPPKYRFGGQPPEFPQHKDPSPVRDKSLSLNNSKSLPSWK